MVIVYTMLREITHIFHIRHSSKYEGRPKSSKLHTDRRTIAEHFSCDNTLLFLIRLEKLVQIFVLISLQLRSMQRWEVYDKSKIWMRLRTFLIDICIIKINSMHRHSLKYKLSDLTDKMKRSFFQAAVTSILLYGCTTWTLTKRLEKKLDGNYTRMLRAILNKS